MKPTPSLEPSISPTTTPIKPTATPCRTPVRMNGTDPGIASVLKICQSDAQNDSIHGSNAGDSVHKNRKESGEKNDENLRPHPDPEPDNDQRHHGDARR